MAFAVRRPVAALILVAAALAASAAVLVIEGVEVDDSADVFIVRDGRPYHAWTRFQERFGQRAVTVFGLTGPDVLGPTGLARLDQVSEAVRALGGPFVTRVSGLQELPLARRLMRERKTAELRGLPLLGGAFIVGDEADPMVLLTVEHGELTRAERAAWVKAVRDETSREIHHEGGIVALGRPLLEGALAEVSSRQGAVLLPVLGVVAVLALMALVKSVIGGGLVLLTTIVTLPITLATMILTGHPLNLLTNGLPVVLLVLCSTVSLHVLRAMLQGDAGADSVEVARRGRRAVAGPSLAASLTTAFGFLALTSSAIGPVREMGAFAALGIVVSYVVAVTTIPAAAALGWIRPRPVRAPVGAARDIPVNAVIAVTAIVLVVSAFGASRLEVHSTSVGFLPDDHPLTRAHEVFDAHGAPVRTIEVTFGGVRALYFASPDVLSDITHFAREVSSQDGVTQVTSIVDALALVRALMLDAVAGTEDEAPLQDALRKLDRDVPHDTLAEYRSGVAMAPLVALLLGEGEAPDWYRDLDQARLDQIRRLLRAWLYASADGGSGAVRVSLSIATSEARAVQRVVRVTAARADGYDTDLKNIRADVTGAAPMAVGVQTALIESQITSLVLAFFLVAVVLIIALASWRLVFIAAIPNLLPLVMLYGGMGWLGIGLDAATVMVGAIALGIAVDDTVHLLALHDPKRAPREAVAKALDHVRWPVVVTTVMTAAGFAVLGASDFVPMARFGVLTAVAMIIALVSDLVVLPALLIRFAMPTEEAELLHFTGRGKFGQWRVRTPRRWFVRLRRAWTQLQQEDPRAALKTLDEFLADTRALPDGPRRHVARGAASYWRLRCLERIASNTEDASEAASLRGALKAHVEAFGEKYGDLEELSARVRRMIDTVPG